MDLLQPDLGGRADPEDESDRYSDHASFAIRSNSPDGLPCAAGSRIPAIVISPYGLAHVAVHGYAEHSTVIGLGPRPAARRRRAVDAGRPDGARAGALRAGADGVMAPSQGTR